MKCIGGNSSSTYRTITTRRRVDPLPSPVSLSLSISLNAPLLDRPAANMATKDECVAAITAKGDEIKAAKAGGASLDAMPVSFRAHEAARISRAARVETAKADVANALVHGSGSEYEPAPAGEAPGATTPRLPATWSRDRRGHRRA